MAEDLNQPELVYKFMGLATHNALWNSKKGAAFAATALVHLPLLFHSSSIPFSFVETFFLIYNLF